MGKATAAPSLPLRPRWATDQGRGSLNVPGLATPAAELPHPTEATRLRMRTGPPAGTQTQTRGCGILSQAGLETPAGVGCNLHPRRPGPPHRPPTPTSPSGAASVCGTRRGAGRFRIEMRPPPPRPSSRSRGEPWQLAGAAVLGSPYRGCASG